MGHDVFRPRTAVREEKRQATEAVGRSFCKTLAEPITNSDSSAKRKLHIEHSSGLVDVMLQVPKGTQLDTSALRQQLVGRNPKRVIVVEVVTAKSSGRPVGEVVVIDQAEGMSAAALKTALSDIAGDRSPLASGSMGRNLFGRGLSDVLRAHHTSAGVQTFDGKQLTIATGEWRKEGWTIEMDFSDSPTKGQFRPTRLDPTTTGTAVHFVIADRKRCHIPDPGDIGYRLANFYMLRLIASDPNVELVLREHRAAGHSTDRIQYDFPVGQVIDRFTRSFDPAKAGLQGGPLGIDFLVARAESERGLRGPGVDRDRRENGLLILDDLDAVYDLTFADPDYEKADFLARIFGVIRVNGLRRVLESYLNAESPSSPLRPDRDGFNRDHEFARALLDFLAANLRPIYERERKLVEEKKHGEVSAETKKRIDDALKHLNKYFQRITDLSGDGTGTDGDVSEPTGALVFFPEHTKLVAGHPRQVLLLVREDVVDDHAEYIATASEGMAVQPESDHIDKTDSTRWRPHKRFLAVRLSVSSTNIGQKGQVLAVIEGKDGGLLEAVLKVDDVLAEPTIEVPETLVFRPETATGRPGRRNNLVLYVNPAAVSAGHYIRVEIARHTGDVLLIDANGTRCDQVNVKLDLVQHQVKGQKVLRVLIPWSGTSWNQFAHVVATAKVSGPKRLQAEATIRLDEPEDAGFFKDVKYGEIDPRAPSQFAAGIITVNINDPLNRHIFGESKTEFDRRLTARGDAQQRLAALLLEEASFRALQHRYDENKIMLPERREIGSVHEEIDKYKYESAVDVHRALTKVRQ